MVMLQGKEHAQAEERVQMATAVAHAIGLALAGEGKMAALTQKEIAEAYPTT